MSSKKQTTGTKKNGKLALTPKLRFPEFRGAEGWEPTTIGALGSFYYGKSAPKWSLAEDAPTPCVRYGELYTKFGPIITKTYSRTNADPETLRFSKGGEILVPRVGEKPEDFGKCCSYLPLKGIAIGEMISVFETKQHPLFYTYYFRHLYKQFAKVVEGQNVKNLYYVELEPLPIHRPSAPEQQRIAECLSSVDELIAAQAQKLDALKTHKKGLMQQLFPREGETQPRLRFPEFQDAGEWKQKALGELCRIRTGKKDANEGAVDGAYPFFTCAEKHIYSHSHSFDAEAILIAGNANVGQTNYYKGKFEAYQRTYVLTDFSDIFVPYLYSVLSANLRPDLLALVQTSAMSYIRLPMLEEYQINAPPSLPEQQRIADCLNTVDDLIAAQTQNLVDLKAHKKGLTQQLFPTPEEVEA